MGLIVGCGASCVLRLLVEQGSFHDTKPQFSDGTHVKDISFTSVLF